MKYIRYLKLSNNLTSFSKFVQIKISELLKSTLILLTDKYKPNRPLFKYKRGLILSYLKYINILYIYFIYF